MDDQPFRLDACPDLAPLRRALEDQGYTQPALAELLNPSDAKSPLEVALDLAAAIRRTAAPSPLNTLARLFVLAQAVPEEAARQAGAGRRWATRGPRPAPAQRRRGSRHDGGLAVRRNAPGPRLLARGDRGPQPAELCARSRACHACRGQPHRAAVRPVGAGPGHGIGLPCALGGRARRAGHRHRHQRAGLEHSRRERPAQRRGQGRVPPWELVRAGRGLPIRSDRLEPAVCDFAAERLLLPRQRAAGRYDQRAGHLHRPPVSSRGRLLDGALQLAPPERGRLARSTQAVGG